MPFNFLPRAAAARACVLKEWQVSPKCSAPYNVITEKNVEARTGFMTGDQSRLGLAARACGLGVRTRR